MFSGSFLDLRYQNKNKPSHLVKQPNFAAAATFSAKTAQKHILSLGKSDHYAPYLQLNVGHYFYSTISMLIVGIISILMPPYLQLNVRHRRIERAGAVVLLVGEDGGEELVEPGRKDVRLRDVIDLPYKAQKLCFCSFSKTTPYPTDRASK